MQAYALTRYGGPDSAELCQTAAPTARDGEVLIKVHAAGLNPVDYKTREGKLRPIHRFALPAVMGNELSGVVVETGPGSSRFAIGDKVFTRVALPKAGAFAEYATVHEDLVAAAPEAIDLTTAAGVPLAGLTALQALRDEIKVTSGTKLLISGGAGGVGTLAIQLAKWLGAHVTTTASARGDALVRRLGADAVIDYTSQNLAELPRSFDAALDLVGGKTLTDILALVKPGGTVVSINGDPEPLTATRDLGAGRGLAALFWLASAKVRRRARAHGVGYRYLFMHPSGEDLHLLAKLIDDKQLEPIVDRVFPFTEIAEAFAYLEQGRAKGKVIVEL